MPEAKTKPTSESVQAYLSARASPAQQADCAQLMTLMQGVTGQPPQMWGPSIVGFGAYHYRYASGHSGSACLLGFAIRASSIAIYLVPDWPGGTALLAGLGPHKMGKGCLHIKGLAKLDLAVLEQLLQGSVAELQKRYPPA